MTSRDHLKSLSDAQLIEKLRACEYSHLMQEAADRLEREQWQPIETIPKHKDVQVRTTFSLGGAEGEEEWETVYWVDSMSSNGHWRHFHDLIHVPLPPTHWKYIERPQIAQGNQ